MKTTLTLLAALASFALLAQSSFATTTKLDEKNAQSLYNALYFSGISLPRIANPKIVVTNVECEVGTITPGEIFNGTCTLKQPARNRLKQTVHGADNNKVIFNTLYKIGHTGNYALTKTSAKKITCETRKDCTIETK
jgi:hypothetical protein